MNEIDNTGFYPNDVTENNGIASAKAFIQKMKDDSDFRTLVAPALAAVPEGNWQGLVSVAQQNGFEFNTEALQSALPSSFFKGAGQNPDRGWQKEA